MFEKLKKIPSPPEIVANTPLSLSLKRLKRERDREVSEIIRGENDRLLVLVGPCSAHAEKPVLEYVERLAALNSKVRDKLVLVPRIYSSKSRTRGVGYMGMLSQPDPSLPEDILKGIIAVRRLNVKVMETGLTAADEMLYPANSPYFEDLFSYIAVGARSCEDQLHRLVASGMDVPVGFKNPTGGSVAAMLNSVYAAQSGHTFKLNEWQVRTSGNPLTHAVLRGATDGSGVNHPNYHYEQVMKVWEEYGKYNLANPAVIVDANHANSGKNFIKQIEICREVMKNRKNNPDFKKIVKGLMIESFLEEGSQTYDEVFGKSITDPCLGWEDTENLLLEIAESV